MHSFISSLSGYGDREDAFGDPAKRDRGGGVGAAGSAARRHKANEQAEKVGVGISDEFGLTPCPIADETAEAFAPRLAAEGLGDAASGCQWARYPYRPLAKTTPGPSRFLALAAGIFTNYPDFRALCLRTISISPDPRLLLVLFYALWPGPAASRGATSHLIEHDLYMFL